MESTTSSGIEASGKRHTQNKISLFLRHLIQYIFHPIFVNGANSGYDVQYAVKVSTV
ncbi:hypothetical protein KIN20_019981 [Parelaphostrongylus tenuis]|uniref:Uncharacterized protein n=1 Tax=Parelaphostrongylus tenuis TaxID=148309 RepID=A0AAD5QQI7_PARTN|nr:hypothetical protein KIN20_019981 [Parelaphostrongylus tenuis]